MARNLSTGTLSTPSSLFTVTGDTTGPTITSSTSARSINENSASGQIVYSAVASDAANGNEQTQSDITYSLSNTGDASAFSINAKTGEVTLLSSPNYEAKPQYVFTVIATDSLNILNLDEVAPTITSGSTANVDEGVANAVVYTTTSIDDSDTTNGGHISSKATGARMIANSSASTI